jgi:Domain of unknown function (DUF1877)
VITRFAFDERGEQSMSMIGHFLVVSAEKLEELRREPETVSSFLDATVEDQDELGADFLDVDKSWHGIHFLLTGSVREGNAPLKWVVFAPSELGEDVGNGPARVLEPDEVVEVSKALAPVTPDKLKRKCDWKLMNDSEIYPQGWRVGDEDFIADNFVALKKLYESAARRHMAVIQWLS